MHCNSADPSIVPLLKKGISWIEERQLLLTTKI